MVMIKTFSQFSGSINESALAPLSDLDSSSYANFKAGDVVKTDRVTKQLLEDIELAAKNAGVNVLATTAVTDHKGIGDPDSRHNKGQALDLSRIGWSTTPHSKLPGSNGGNQSNYKQKQSSGSEFFAAADALVGALIGLGYRLITQDEELRSKYSSSLTNSESVPKAIIWKYDSPRAGNHFNHIHISNNDASLPSSPQINPAPFPGSEPSLTIDAQVVTKLITSLKQKSFPGKASDSSAEIAAPSNLGDLEGSSPGIPQLTRNMGLGRAFPESLTAEYLTYKNNPKVHWAVYDIDRKAFIDSSKNSNDQIYAASVSKAVTAACALNKFNSKLPSPEDFDKLKLLLIKSKNDVWSHFTELAGGSKRVNEWASSMGWNMSPGRFNGNSVSARGMCLFWADVLNRRFPGSDIIEAVSNSCQTSDGRSRKYIPADCRIGGKTGLYQQYMHDSAWIISPKGKFAITVLTELSSAPVVATMFGGLFREYCK